MDPHLIRGSLDTHESAHKRHLDRFSRFSQLTHEPDTQTDTQTCRRCGLKILWWLEVRVLVVETERLMNEDGIESR